MSMQQSTPIDAPAEEAEPPSRSALLGKPWWQSRTLIGAGVVVAAQAARLIAPEVEIDVGATTDAALSLLSLLGGVLAWWGRVRAEAPVRFRAGRMPAGDQDDRGHDAGAAGGGGAGRMHSDPVESLPAARDRARDGFWTGDGGPFIGD